VVSGAQLRRCGLTAEAIRRRVRARRLHRLHYGVYAVGHLALTARSHYLAAVLACGEGALASHRTAAALWQLRSAPTSIEVTAPRGRKPRAGIIVHRSRVIDADDHATIDRIPVTSLARTLVDLADVLNQRQLANAVHQADILRLLDLVAIQQALDRLPGRTGHRRLHRVLATYAPDHDAGALQQRFLDFCRSHALPTPQTQVPVAGYVVDFLWPRANLAVETDGAATHHTRRAFYADRRRDRALAAAGIQVIRVTWPDLDEAESLRSELAAILARSG
jgi:hypothetical protein